MSVCYVCLGALKNELHYHPRCARALFGSTRIPKLNIEMGKLHTAALAMVGSTTLSGIQKKISLGLSTDRQTLQVAASGGRFILKPPTETYPQLPEIEHLTMRLAELSGIEIAQCGLIEIDGRLAFVTRRFDRRADGSKVRQEDFCQLAEKRPSEKYSGSGELCARIIRQFASEPPVEFVKLFEQMLFAWWVGNGDLHLKNLSLYVDDDGIVKLTPAYDLVATRLVIADDELAMPIIGRSQKLKRSTWRKFAQYCDLPERVFERVLARQVAALPKALDLIERSTLAAYMREQLAAHIAARTAILQESSGIEDQDGESLETS
jgi:serine/threonine-protein kinase HipA